MTDSDEYDTYGHVHLTTAPFMSDQILYKY